MEVVKTAKKVGLALGAGGAKALAHIGVLQVLLKENIPIDMVAGSSMGAIIGAAYAAGTDVDLLAKLACQLNQSLFVDINIPRMGLLKGKKAQRLIELLTHGKSFEDLNIPFAAVATDVEKGERITFTQGDLARTVRASMSIPGIFNPVRYGGRLLVDGAVTERLPVLALKEMGADFVIGVDVKFFARGKGYDIPVKNIYDIIMQSIEILETKVFIPCLDSVDILITPDTHDIATTDYTQGKLAIERGREAASEKLEELKSALDQLGRWTGPLK